MKNKSRRVFDAGNLISNIGQRQTESQDGGSEMKWQDARCVSAQTGADWKALGRSSWEEIKYQAYKFLEKGFDG